MYNTSTNTITKMATYGMQLIDRITQSLPEHMVVHVTSIMEYVCGGLDGDGYLLKHRNIVCDIIPASNCLNNFHTITQKCVPVNDIYLDLYMYIPSLSAITVIGLRAPAARQYHVEVSDTENCSYYQSRLNFYEWNNDTGRLKNIQQGSVLIDVGSIRLDRDHHYEITTNKLYISASSKSTPYDLKDDKAGIVKAPFINIMYALNLNYLYTCDFGVVLPGKITTTTGHATQWDDYSIIVDEHTSEYVCFSLRDNASGILYPFTVNVPNLIHVVPKYAAIWFVMADHHIRLCYLTLFSVIKIEPDYRLEQTDE